MAKKKRVVNEWMAAPEWVVDIVKRMVDRYHEPLKTARIGIIMRTVTPQNNGRWVYGGVERVSAKAQVNLRYDYVIWIAKGRFDTFRAEQREALVDHLLCHLKWNASIHKAGFRPHDIEEFKEVLERHGYWWPDAYQVHEVASQARLFDPDALARAEMEGSVEAVTPTGDQVADFLVGMDRLSLDQWSEKGPDGAA